MPAGLLRQAKRGQQTGMILVRHPPLDTCGPIPDTYYMNPDDIREEIEAKVVDLIKAKVENEEMTEERAQAIAARVLEVLKPGMTLEELYAALPKLDDNFTEIGHVIVPYLKDYENGVTKIAAKQVGELIKAGRYKDAQDLADRVIHQNVKLVWTGTGKTPAETPPSDPS